MENLYKYTTAEQQIQKLKSQHLSFDDEKKATTILKTYGYYNIINGYRDPYITREYGNKTYNPDVTFEQIFALFVFDHNIRNAILLSMIDLEEHLKAVVADIISESFGSNHEDYLNKNNYRDKKVNDPKFSRNNILSGMVHVAEHSQAQPIKYYRESKKIIPPWILLKGIYFGTLVNYIRFFKAPQRDRIIKTLYSGQVTETNMGELKDLLSDTLFMCLEYRNLAAHGGRVYNYTPKSSIRALSEENTRTKRGLPQLLFALSFFYYSQPYSRLERSLNKSLNDYCHAYMNDIQRIEKTTGLEITVENHVWVNEKTQKYHTNPHCSGSKDCKNITLKEATELNYIPCKKCCKDIIPVA